MDTCAKNGTYILHETSDSLIYSLDNNFLTKPNDHIKNCIVSPSLPAFDKEEGDRISNRTC